MDGGRRRESTSCLLLFFGKFIKNDVHHWVEESPCVLRSEVVNLCARVWDFNKKKKVCDSWSSLCGGVRRRGGGQWSSGWRCSGPRP